jgi:hypothetical protein
VAACAWKPHTFIRRHGRDQSFDASHEYFAPGHGGRIDGEQSMPDPRRVTGLEERVVLEAERGAGQRAAQELDGQRQHGAFRTAYGREAAGESRFGIGGGIALAIERPAKRNVFALFGMQHDLAAHDLGERQVDHERRLLAARKHGSDRIGAEKRPLAPPGIDRRRRVGEAQPHHPGFGHGLQVVGHCAGMMAAGHARKGDAAAPRTLHRLGGSERQRLVGEAAGRIDQAASFMIVHDARRRRSLRAPGAQVTAVKREARKPMGGDAARLGVRERFGGGARHAFGRAGAAQRRGRKNGQIRV